MIATTVNVTVSVEDLALDFLQQLQAAWDAEGITREERHERFLRFKGVVDRRIAERADVRENTRWLGRGRLAL